MTPERTKADGHDRMTLVIMATPKPLPERVDRPRWPVHVTVVGNFHVDTEAVDTIPPLVQKAAHSVAAFDVKLGPHDWFGTEKDVPVLLASHPSFQVLHESLATPLAGLPRFDPVEPQFWHAEYRAHASLGPAVRVREGDALPLRVLTLVALDQRVGRSLYAADLSAGGAPTREFVAEAHRQSALATESDQAPDDQAFVDAISWLSDEENE